MINIRLAPIGFRVHLSFFRWAGRRKSDGIQGWLPNVYRSRPIEWINLVVFHENQNPSQNILWERLLPICRWNGKIKNVEFGKVFGLADKPPILVACNSCMKPFGKHKVFGLTDESRRQQRTVTNNLLVHVTVLETADYGKHQTWSLDWSMTTVSLTTSEYEITVTQLGLTIDKPIFKKLLGNG